MKPFSELHKTPELDQGAERIVEPFNRPAH
jgi:hypothetical protein